jgi:hypothetical protein
MPDFYQLLRVKGEGDALVDEARRIRSFGILKSLKMFEKDMIRTRLSKNSFKVNIKPGVRIPRSPPLLFTSPSYRAFFMPEYRIE